MNNSFRKYTVFNLIKLNLKVCRLPRIICFSIMFFLFISYKIIEPLNDFSLKYNLDINIWDGFFKVVTYPIIVLCFYLPFVIIVTSIINLKIKHYQYIIVRSKKKVLWIISKLIANLLIGLLIATIFFLSAFIISYIFFGFDKNWSSTITNINVSMKLVDALYLSNFVFSLTPIQAIIISFLEIYIATAIIINFRDVLTNYISNIYICDLVISIYIFISIVSFMYNLTIGIFKIMKYIGMHTIAIISFHRFDSIKIYDVTLTQSFTISLIFLSILILINLMFNRRLVVKGD
ncbi:MAG: hypothetical protein ABF633_01265 [Clostridium sp.]|uniref:hypothetical protein n=1 Tax=Clostridium sp. TaxID=1506 RepID=UPI0039E7BBD9